MTSVLIICGGLGGRLAPGIAVAERLVERGISCRLYVARAQVDQRLCRRYVGLDFASAPGAAFRLRPLSLPRFLWGQVALAVYATRELRREDPAVVYALGGFLSPLFVLLARIRGIRVVLHCVNRLPGRTLGLLMRYADRVYLPHGGDTRRLGVVKRRITPVPVRKEIRRVPRQYAREKLGFDVPGRLLVVVGGSDGAESLNRWLQDNMEGLCARGINIFAVTGLDSEAVASGRLSFRTPEGAECRVRLEAFTDQISLVYSAADLVVSRTGATTQAELIQCATPSIQVPRSRLAGGRELANAEFLERYGACVLVREERMDSLRAEIEELIFNDWLLERFRRNLEHLRREDAAEEVAADLRQMVRNPPQPPARKRAPRKEAMVW